MLNYTCTTDTIRTLLRRMAHPARVAYICTGPANIVNFYFLIVTLSGGLGACWRNGHIDPITYDRHKVMY